MFPPVPRCERGVASARSGSTTRSTLSGTGGRAESRAGRDCRCLGRELSGPSGPLRGEAVGDEVEGEWRVEAGSVEDGIVWVAVE